MSCWTNDPQSIVDSIIPLYSYFVQTQINHRFAGETCDRTSVEIPISSTGAKVLHIISPICSNPIL
jgi:hypothetical protein